MSFQVLISDIEKDCRKHTHLWNGSVGWKGFFWFDFFLVDVVIKVENKVLKELLLSYLSFVPRLLQLGLINMFNQLEKGDELISKQMAHHIDIP